jgi:hypothetical protein
VKAPPLRTLLWHVLVDELGIREPITPSERARINSAIAELVTIDATPDDVRARIRRWPKVLPNAVLTARGLVANWSLLDPTRTPNRGDDDIDYRAYVRA